MRIVFFSEFTDLHASAPGFAVRSLALAKHLPEEGFKVTLVSPDKFSVDSTSYAVLPIQLRDPLIFRRRGGGLRKLLPTDLAVACAFLNMLRSHRPDGVVAALHDPLLAVLVLFVSRIACGTAVFDAHDSWLVLEKEHRGDRKNAFRKLLERFAMAFATGVTTVTPTLKRMVVGSYHVRSSKISVVFNGAEMTSGGAAVVKEIDILHLGSPRSYYETESFIDALGVSGVPLSVVFLGCDDESYVQRIRQKVIQLGLGSHVSFLPPAGRADVLKWLARTRMGLSTLSVDPIYRCAIGVKVFEYLANGVPILHLGPSEGETARLIVAGGCGACASDIPEMASVIQRILTDPAALVKMSASALTVARKYSWSASARSMAEALRAKRGR